ncbi:hypothetical protein B0H13DRAFT_1916805 [Mycena leptocephala]|nr:hypothetical protein B0H13DRAFT_1916805 [Mycena leptocephala]
MSEVQDIEFIGIIEDGSSASDPLTYPPWDPDMHTHEKYLRLQDILGSQEAQALVRKIKRDNKENSLWIKSNCGSCLQQWRTQKGELTCPTCRAATQLVHQDWVLISPQQQHKNKDIKHRKRAEKKKATNK